MLHPFSQLNDEIGVISSSLSVQTLSTNAYKATSANFEYVGCSYTCPAGKTAIVYGRTQYSSGKPIGIALSTSSTQLNVLCESSNVGSYVLRTPLCMVSSGDTVYLWDKRVEAPSSTNNCYIIGMVIG